MAQTREPAPAKLNLSLRVLGRRPDGLHEIQSLVAFLDWGDEVRVRRTSSGSEVTCACVGAPDLDGRNNLAAQAARRLLEAQGAEGGCAVEITKRIPVGAGLGGGSSDAAATLRALARLLDPAPTWQTLHQVAATLGADVPVCLTATPAWVSGWGQHVVPASEVPRVSVCLVHPPFTVSTAEAYGRLEASSLDQVPARPRTPGTPEALATLVENDFWPGLRRRHPALDAPRRQLAALGAIAVGLSGSGPTLFGLFRDPAAARRAAAALARQGHAARGCQVATAPTSLEK